MPRPFARHYDAIYADKDYDRDIAAFETLLDGRALRNGRLLELGAGTGNHTLRLAPRVGDLASVEIDADFHQVLAGKVAAAGAKNVRTYACPVQELPAGEFDAAVAFFHVLNYIGPQELPGFLEGVARRLKPGAPFIADAWNGAAAQADPPRAERREKTAGGVRIVQDIRPDFRPGERELGLGFEVEVGAERIRERLMLYLWFREELQSMLEQAGFSDVQFWDYRAFPAPATPRSWILWLRAVRR
jgi:SAM-dependent methyltransferase